MLSAENAQETADEPVIVIAGAEPAEPGYDQEVALARAEAALDDALAEHEAQTGHRGGVKGFISRAFDKLDG
jgi:hypothetical protein